MDLSKFAVEAKKKSAENRTFLQKLKSKNARGCKTTSPIFYQTDIERVAKSLRMKPGDFIEKYLRIDEDKDFVLKSSPCPFLDAENYCSVYEDRPKACREYPHTNRKKMVQILDLTFKNTLVCPAVLEMVERLKKVLPAKGAG